MPRRFTKKLRPRRQPMSRSKSSFVDRFEREITVKFFETLLMIKLFHWKTQSYATHKATDELYGKLNDNMDKFIEILLGKTNSRIDLSSQLSVPLFDLKSVSELREKIMQFKAYLVNLSNYRFMKVMSNTDLLNIRDEILGDMNQFLYLLTFH